MLAPLPRRSLASGAYEALVEAIVTGTLPPGSRIRDGELAAQLQISRMPVREALKRLESEGLVETVPNRETRVAPIRAERAAQAFPVIATLQALGTRLGVPALSQADDRRMASLDRDRARALAEGDVIAAIELDDAFHGVLLTAARNDELIRAIDRLMPRGRGRDIRHFPRRTREAASRDPADILAACRRRDAHTAAELVEAN